MTQANTLSQAAPPVSLLLFLAGGLAGVLLSYGVLSGDDQGQVNLLLLLLLYVLVPVLTLLLSAIALLRRRGRGVAGWLLELPVWSAAQQAALMRLSSSSSRKAWLIYQGQYFSLGFSLACLLAYLALLLATDISFVWRSTLLDAGQLLPVLDWLAWPWGFWSEAQPSLSLLELTRDFRLGDQEQGQDRVGLWWRYILAAQISYNLLPRTVALLLAGRALRRSQQAQQAPLREDAANRIGPAAPELAPLVSAPARPFVLLDWARLTPPQYQAVQDHYGLAQDIVTISPQSDARALASQLQQHNVVVLVKGWEPPLGELADVLAGLSGGGDCLLLPLDWNGAGLRAARPVHLKEWRRFAAGLGPWKVLNSGEAA